MTNRVCLHCGADISHKNPRAKFCSRDHKEKHSRSTRRKADPEKFRARDKAVYQRRREAYLANDQRHYHEVVKPRGVRLSHRLVEMFDRLGKEDPSKLPAFANKVLEWRPKGFIMSLKVALHPYGELEGNWLYYAEMSPEEAVVCYEAEA